MSERLTQRTKLGTAVFNNVDIGDIAKKLCDLEDKIEQGKILELPCKVGDTFYGIQGENVFAYCCYGFKYGWRRGTDDYGLYALTVYEMEFVWGEEAFATEEEAEAKLREMEGDRE